MAATDNTKFVPTPEYQMNAPGSQYADTFSHDTTRLIREAIEYNIFDLAPKQFDPLKIINMLPMLTKPDSEFTYIEKVWSRQPYTVKSFNTSTKKITLAGTYSTADEFKMRVNTKFFDPNGIQYIVKTPTYSSSADSCTIVVEKVDTTGSTWTPSSSDFAADDILTISSQIVADGMDEIGYGNKVQTVQRYNYFEMFQQAQKWTRLELIKMMNNGTTNIMDFQKKENLDQLRLDMFSALFGGSKGEASVYKPSNTSTSYKAKTMDGIFAMMVNGGSEHASPTWSGLQTAFEALAFSTNKKSVGGVRVLMARDEILTELAKLYKFDKTRYAPTDRIANLNLYEYQIGTMRFVPVNAELFSADAGVLPPSWDSRLLCLDINNFKRCQMRGYPYIDGGETKQMKDGLETDYVKWWVRGYMSLQANGVDGSFYLDVQ